MGSRLGQHFLTSERYQRRIASLVSSDRVIEIGPGKGALTRHLVTEKRDVIGIEKDSRFIPYLKETFPSLRVVEGDVREVLSEVASSFSSPYEIVGNIPYYLSGFLFRIIGELEVKPERCVFLIQKEVAEKLTDTSRMNMLRAFVLLWGDPVYEFGVSARYFSPPPRVDSAVVSITKTKKGYSGDESTYTRLVKTVFAHPRKTLRKNVALGTYTQEEIEVIEGSGVDMNLRPGDLTFDILCRIALLLENK